jgi:hypothetical protein
VSSADGEFDDLACDSMTSTRAFAKDLGFNGLFAVSDYVQLDSKGRPIIDGDVINPADYYCWIYGCTITQSEMSANSLIGDGNRGGIRYQLPPYTSIVPFDWPDSSTKYRLKNKAVSFNLMLSGASRATILRIAKQLFQSQLRIYILDATDGFPLNLTHISQTEVYAGYTGNYLAMLDLSNTGQGETTKSFKKMDGSTAFNVDVIVEEDRSVTTGGITSTAYGEKVLIACESDNEYLNYSGSKRLKIGIEYGLIPAADPDSDLYGQVKVDFQLVDKPLAINAISSPLLTI